MSTELPKSLHAVALVDARVCAAIGGASVSWWFGQVAAGVAPEPAIRQPRFTRWRLQEVVAFWERFAEPRSDETSQTTIERAKRASSAAKRKREGRVPKEPAPNSARKSAWAHRLSTLKPESLEPEA